VTQESDTNAAVWKTDRGISQWLATEEERERRRGEARRLMAELMPFEVDEDFTFLDLGAGTGAATRAVLDRYPKASAILADYSSQMMNEGEKALGPFRGRYRYVEFDLGAADWPAEIPRQVQAIISSLSVHHLPDRRKRELFTEVFDRLAPGGWYLNYDPVTADDPVVEEAWQRVNDRRDPQAAAKRSHRTPEEQFHYENHVRHMAPLAPQLQFLLDAGFRGVDAYWKELDYVIYGGMRPLS
jgi:tRNA (cmo5U34)-methyltransferase